METEQVSSGAYWCERCRMFVDTRVLRGFGRRCELCGSFKVRFESGEKLPVQPDLFPVKPAAGVAAMSR